MPRLKRGLAGSAPHRAGARLARFAPETQPEKAAPSQAQAHIAQEREASSRALNRREAKTHQ